MEKAFPEQYYVFIEKFNQREFYECHDLLEEIWMEDKTNKFLQGLLQVAVGIYHFECGNIKGARWMLGNARKYLSRYVPVHWQLDVNAILQRIDACMQLLPETDVIPYEQVNQIPFPYFLIQLEEH